MLLRRFPIPPQHHWFPWAAQASTRMSRIPRLAGYGFMAAAALLAAVMKKEGAQTVGPLPAVAVALVLGMVGVMLVLTDLMVRGRSAQVDAARSEERRVGKGGVGPGGDRG